MEVTPKGKLLCGINHSALAKNNVAVGLSDDKYFSKCCRRVLKRIQSGKTGWKRCGYRGMASQEAVLDANGVKLY
jgi:hypothetical protein